MARFPRTNKQPNCRRLVRLRGEAPVRPPSISPRSVATRRRHTWQPEVPAPAVPPTTEEPEVPMLPSTAPAVLQPLVLSVAEAAAALGVSDDLIYELTARGKLPCLRMGRRRVIPRQAVEALVNKAMQEFDAG